MRSIEFHAIIAPSKRYGAWPVLHRASRREPKLKAGEIAIRIKLELPDDWNKPTTLPLTIAQNQIQRPTAHAV
jgi:hypothetical protein